MKEDIQCIDEMHEHKNPEWYEQLKASIWTSGWDKRKEKQKMNGFLLGYGHTNLLRLQELLDETVPVTLQIPGEQYDVEKDMTPKLLVEHVYDKVEEIKLRKTQDGETRLLVRIRKPEKPTEPANGVGIGCSCAV